MGLTNQVRDFFTNRIQKALNAKEQVIRERIAKQANIPELCLARLAQDNPTLNIVGLVKEERRLKEQDKAIEKELNKVHADMNSVARELDIYSYSGADSSNFIAKAKSLYEDKIIAEHFPEEVAELATIKQAGTDVEGAVLLATTEQKLLFALTDVLKRYGGDLGDLKDVVGLQ